MYAFTYHLASGLRQASNMLEKLEEPKLLAGGQSLLPTMKLRLAAPKNIIDLGAIEGLSEIELRGRTLVIGAMTR
ncbi:MAG: FAD binding domain-containing protein, partial [Bradyrhizobiaceae bacterium]|nr:FAD binding domain-containing protein [Bradyrhizobiaceae bacterium]